MPAPTRLIVNADDIGYTEAVTDTILDCHENGIVTSATLMVNMPGAEYAAKRAIDHPELGIGLHLNLTEGHPIAAPGDVAGLLDEEGRLLDNGPQTRNLWRNDAAYASVRTEIHAQMQRLIDLGVEPTHCDSHHGIHKLPVVCRALASVLEEFRVPKLRTPLAWHRLARGERSPAAIAEWVRLVGRRLPVVGVLAWNHWRLARRGFRMPAWKARSP